MDLARLVLGVDTRQLKDGERDLGRFASTAQGTANAINSAMKKVGAALGVAFGVDAIIGFGRQSVQAAIDAQEMGSAFDVVFGGMAMDVREWAETTGDALGRSTQEMQRAALAFQELFGKALAPAQAAELSKQFAVLTQDLASFKNLSNEVAQQKLFSGLIGEAEPLRAVGVFLDEATLKAKAAALGMGDFSKELTSQEKIVVRAAAIQEQLAQASGDVARTSDSTANQIKTYQAAVEELQVAIGQRLLPTLTPLITSAANITTAFANLVQGGTVLGFTLTEIGGVVMTVVGGWAAYRTTLLAATAAQGAYTAAMVVATRVIGGAQAATVGLNTALFSNPFTAVAGAVGILAGAFIALANAQRQARAETDNLIRSLDASIRARGADVASSRAQADVERMRREGRLAEINAEQARLKGPRGLGSGNRALELEAQQLTWEIVELEGTVRLADRTLKDMEKTAGSIVVPVAQSATAVSGLSNELRGASGSASTASDEFQRLYDRLFPFQAASRQFAADMALIQRSRLSDAEKEAAIARLESQAFRSRTSGLGDARVSDNLLRDDPLVDLDKSSMEYLEQMGNLRDKTRADTLTIADSFAQMSQRITSSLQGLANSIRSGDFLGILGGVLDIFMQLGSAGVFGGGLQTRLTAPTNRSMGGPVYSGKPYIVGERGPEWFTPPGTGRIVSNDNMAGSRVHVTVGIDPRNGNLTAFVDSRTAPLVPVAANAGAMQAQAMSARSASRRVRG